jgi:hypothetical protein
MGVAFSARANQFFTMGLWETTPVADFWAVFGQSATGVASYNEEVSGPAFPAADRVLSPDTPRQKGSVIRIVRLE